MCHRTESFWSSDWSFVVWLGARCLNSGWLVATTCLQVGGVFFVDWDCGPIVDLNCYLNFLLVFFHWVSERVFASNCVTWKSLTTRRMQVCHRQGFWRAWAAATQAGLGKIGCFSSIGQEQCGCLMVFDGVWWCLMVLDGNLVSTSSEGHFLNLLAGSNLPARGIRDGHLPRFQHFHWKISPEMPDIRQIWASWKVATI